MYHLDPYRDERKRQRAEIQTSEYGTSFPFHNSYIVLLDEPYGAISGIVGPRAWEIREAKFVER
jgi:hypothetical protein